MKGEKDPRGAPKEVAEMLACGEARVGTSPPPSLFYPHPSTCGTPTRKRGGKKRERERGGEANRREREGEGGPLPSN